MTFLVSSSRQDSWKLETETVRGCRCRWKKGKDDIEMGVEKCWQLMEEHMLHVKYLRFLSHLRR